MAIYQGYIVLVATFINRFVALGALYSSGLLIVPLEDTFDVSRGYASLFPSIYGCMALLSALIAGYLQDLLANHDRPVSIIFFFGGFCLGGGMICASYAETFEIALFCASIIGTGIGFVGFSTSGILAQWFHKWKGTALLIGMSGNGAGSFAFTLGLQALFNFFEDSQCKDQVIDESLSCEGQWRPALCIFGGISLFMVVTCAFCIRLPYPDEVERFETANDMIDSKEEVTKSVPAVEILNYESSVTGSDENSDDLRQDRCNEQPISDNVDNSKDESEASKIEVFGDQNGGASILNDGKGRSGNIACPRKEGCISSVKRESSIFTRQSSTSSMGSRRSSRARRPSLTVKETVLTRTFVILLIWEITSSITFNNFFAHVQAFAISKGMSEGVGAFALSLTGIAMLLGSYSLGYISDRIGHVRTLQIAVLSLMFSVVVWPMCASPWSLWTVSFFYGYFAVGLPSIPLAILTKTFGRVSHLTILSCIGIIHGVQAPGKLVGPVVMGMMYDRYGDYVYGSLFTAFVMFIGIFALLFLPTTEWQIKIVSKKYPQFQFDSL